MFIPSKRRIATLISLIGEVKGRVELQKIIFILQNEGIDFDMMYSYNVYGPFSEDLQIEIDTLCNQEGIISEDKPDSQSFRTYKLKEKGLKFANDELVKENGTLVNYLGNLNRDELELISSIYYFKNLEYTDDMVKSKISTLKSRIFAGYDNAQKKYSEIKNIPKQSLEFAV
jgi:uncharacterized protein